ncbi:MAG TPA: fasciclin domain-containing protein [Patescibacteria group bacterium]|nr:fasciclin domain-containing protein [Patescibacteria group bacterium]
MKNIFETILDLDYFSLLVAMVKKAEMVESLRWEGPLTLFGPHNGAFSTYTTYDPDDLAHYDVVAPLEEILKDKKSARETLSYFLVPGRLTLNDLLGRTSIIALDGNDIPIEATNGSVIVGNSSIMNYDFECTNGIIHVTGEVLQPTLLAIKKPAS